MRAEGTFDVSEFVPTSVVSAIATGVPVGVATMIKTYTGDIAGTSSTLFTSAFDQGTGVGTYIAMESFDGTVAGRTGTVNFAHSATTSGSDRSAEFFVVVPGSATGDLVGLTGGGMTVDPDGTHRVWFDYDS